MIFVKHIYKKTVIKIEIFYEGMEFEIRLPAVKRFN